MNQGLDEARVAELRKMLNAKPREAWCVDCEHPAAWHYQHGALRFCHNWGCQCRNGHIEG